MRYKGKGEHSVSQLESIIEGLQEQLHLINVMDRKAPEMLEMLKDIADELESGDTPHVYKIRELIKQATEV